MRLKFWLTTICFSVCTICNNFYQYPIMAKTTPPACVDFEFIFARGSGSPLNDKDYSNFKKSTEESLSRNHSDFSVNFYELGSDYFNGTTYPATTIDPRHGLKFISENLLIGLNESVNRGVKELQGRIEQVNKLCPNTKFIIAGYSQGAMVISRTIKNHAKDQDFSDKIAYAATFGDPYLYLPEGAGLYPDACKGKNLSSYRMYAPDCHAHTGLLGPNKPYEPKNFIGKVGLWCTYYDVFCSHYIQLHKLIDAHISYDTQGIYVSAAQTIVQYLNKIYSTTAKPGTNQDTAILIDTTGSMDARFKQYKAQILNLATNSLAGGGRVALIEFRDLAERFKPTLRCDFSCTRSQFEDALNSLEIKDGAGGFDAEESSLSAMMFAMNNLAWQRGANKSILLFSDAGFHNPDLDGTTLRQVILRSMELDPVNIYVVSESYLRETYHELINKTNGDFFGMSNNGDLYAVEDIILNRPVAILPMENYFGSPGDELIFDASSSYALGDAKIDHYEWDLNFDGFFEKKTILPIIKQTYPEVSDGFMQVKVVDTNNKSSTMSAFVSIKHINTLLPIINNLEATAGDKENTYQISYQKSDDTHLVMIGLDELFAGTTNETSFEITDHIKSTTITLTPVNESGEKGKAISAILHPDGNLEFPEPSSGQTQDLPPETPPETPSEPSSETPNPEPENDLNSTKNPPTNSTHHQPSLPHTTYSVLFDPKNAIYGVKITTKTPKAPDSGSR